MFFQSIYAKFTQQEISAVELELFVNKNALGNTYIGTKEYAEGENVF